jgi:hypothetical protein
MQNSILPTRPQAGQQQTGEAIGSLQKGQRVVLLVGSVGTASPSGSLLEVAGLHGGEGVVIQ